MYAKVLAEAWRDLNERKEELAHAVAGTSMRHSMSGKCSRQIHYYLTHTEVTNPFDLPAVWATGLGSRIHQWWQEALVAAFPNCKMEVDVHIPSADSSGHVDAVITEADDTTISLELKSKNGFGFKFMAEGNNPPPYDAMVQCCVNAYGLNADKAVLVYMSLESISRSRAKKFGLAEHERIMKEYHYDKAYIIEVAEKELARWAAIRKSGDATPRHIPDPEYPSSAVVYNPSNGMLAINGSPTGSACWQCGYCSWQNQCIQDLNDASSGHDDDCWVACPHPTPPQSDGEER